MPQAYPCPLCGRVFKNSVNLTAHLRGSLERALAMGLLEREDGFYKVAGVRVRSLAEGAVRLREALPSVDWREVCWPTRCPICGKRVLTRTHTARTLQRLIELGYVAAEDAGYRVDGRCYRDGFNALVAVKPLLPEGLCVCESKRVKVKDRRRVEQLRKAIARRLRGRSEAAVAVTVSSLPPSLANLSPATLESHAPLIVGAWRFAGMVKTGDGYALLYRRTKA